ncbi:MAG: PspC domain-containing protein [Bacteroidetes bacterium]|nr:PspC domain-containing protein [Bacteroidota bacterium]
MKKVININFQGTVVPIEESSYELLQQYIESLRVHFAGEEGKDEIINDIESRISELFQERIKNGSTCITDDDVNTIIDNMGRPEELADDEMGADSEKNKGEKKKESFTESTTFNWKGKRLYRDENNKIIGGVCSGIAAYFDIDPIIVRILFVVTGVGFLLYILLWAFVPGSFRIENGARKRLYRHPDDKIIGGVCSGIGSYFNVNPWLIRVLFLIPFISFIFRWGHIGAWSFPHFLSFSFSPGSFIVYVILWLVIPEASTTAEKLEMKGEKVDLNSIKNSVLMEMKGVGERVGKLGKEAGEMAREKGPEIGQQIHQAATRSSGIIGRIIAGFFKIFAYFILGCIALALIIALFAFAVVAVGLFPLKAYVLTDGWQAVLAWGTLIFFIAIPVIGIITFIIRRLARIRSQNKIMRWSFIAMWILGIVCFLSLITSLGKDFRSSSSVNTYNLKLENPHVQYLEVEPINNGNYNRGNNWFKLEPYATLGIEDDTAYISNIAIRIEKSETDSFQVTITKMANGRTRRYADTLAGLIQFNISQQDSALTMDRSIAINTTDKFRNQNVEVRIAVPVGHYIKISKNFHRLNIVHFSGFNNGDDWYFSDDDDKGNSLDYNYGIKYLMKADGLYTEDGMKVNDKGWNSSDNDNSITPPKDDAGYRYNKSKDSPKINSGNRLQIIQENLDSLKDLRQKEMDLLRDSLRKSKEEIDKKLEKLNKSTALVPACRKDESNVGSPFIMSI